MTTATMSKTQDVTAATDAPTTDTLATRGIKAAARFLERQGYGILEHGWLGKSGSADLIATDDGDLVFVEVKTRSNEDRGMPANNELASIEMELVTAMSREYTMKTWLSGIKEGYDYVLIDCMPSLKIEGILLTLVDARTNLARVGAITFLTISNIFDSPLKSIAFIQTFVL